MTREKWMNARGAWARATGDRGGPLPRGWFVFLAVVAIFITTGALFRTQPLDVARHEDAVASLRQLKEVDAVLNRQILEARFGVLPNYEPLGRATRQLRAALESLERGPSAIYHQGQAAVDQALHAYKDVLARQEALLERFTSENAVLRGALGSLPGAAQALADQAAEAEDFAVGALVRDLLHGLLLYQFQPAAGLRSRLLEVSGRLRGLRVQAPGLAAALRTVLAHGETILVKRQEVDGLLHELLRLPATGYIDRLDVEYHRWYGEAVRQLAVTRLFLYLSSVVLLLCVGYAMLRLDRSRAELQQRASDQQQLVEELSRTQDQLLQSQKMEAIGRLAGGVAHDFNNLLTVIIGRAEILLSRLHPGGPTPRGVERINRDVELIKRTADRATRLTRQLLAFSRKQVLQPRVLDLNEILANLSPMLQRLIGEDVDLVMVQGGPGSRVKADATQIEQIILNLVLNARDAMPDGGTLTLEVANVDLDDAFVRDHPAGRRGPHVALVVKDTGTGMDAETVSHIFEPFFTTKEQGKGTGLGLSTVYGIVNQHDGWTSVETAPGRGAAFTIYLPRVDGATEVGPADAAALGSPPGTETILLVEDHDDVRSLAREILRAKGYGVLDAEAPQRALELAEHHAGTLHLLVTDVVMPQMSGPALAERLAHERPEMKVLYISGYTNDALVHRGVLAPGVALLEKPFSPERLARKVREVLDTIRTGAVPLRALPARELIPAVLDATARRE